MTDAADEPLEPFADWREQAAAEDAMRATLPPGHLEALAQEDVELDPRVLSGELCGECATTGHSRCRGVCLVDAAVPAVGGVTPATDRDTARQQVIDVLATQFGVVPPSPWMNQVADAVMAEVVDPLLATITRVQALAAELNATPTTGNDGLLLGRVAERVRRALDGGGT